jgi:ubiquinone/menaquinone biosynthesis C-methylase UbiE
MNTYETLYYRIAGNELSFITGSGKKILDHILSNYKEGDELLEIGCGQGGLAGNIPEDLLYTGVDVSDYALRNAKIKYKNKDNIKFIKEQSHNLPFENNKFAFIVSIFSLEHFISPKESLNEMCRVLKKGGSLIILAPNLELPISLPNAIRHKTILYKIYFIFLRIFDYFFRLLGRYSFRIIKENYTEKTGRYKKKDDDLRYVVSSYEVINYLQKEQKFEIVFVDRLNNFESIKNKLRKLITYLPKMKYYGDNLFVIMKK